MSNFNKLATTGKPPTIGRLTNQAGGLTTFSGTDLLYLNQFVNDDFTEIPKERNLEFRSYWQKQVELENRKKEMDIAQKREEPVQSVYTKQATQNLPYADLAAGPSTVIPTNTQMKEKSYLICVNSKRRDTIRYPNIADFKLFLGRSFTNVIRLKLVSLEFPNVDQAITDSNNKLYWINKEDLDLGFPVYTATITNGSYSLTTIQTELENNLNTVNLKRRGGTGIPHYYIVTKSDDTDYVSFTSILAQQVPTNPIQTFQGTGVIRVNQPTHGYDDNERIHIIGVRGLVGGIQSSFINGAYNINKLNDDAFTFEIAQTATESVEAGGTLVKTGREANWQFLAGEYKDTIADRLGFRSENSSDTIPIENPLTSVVKPITGITVGSPTLITCPNHGLRVGDRVYLNKTYISPSIYESERYRGIFTISAIPTPDTFEIPYVSDRVSDISDAYVGTQILTLYFPNHGFNRIVNIQQASPGIVEVTTYLDHNLQTGGGIYLNDTNSDPPINGYHSSVTVISPDTFQIPFAQSLTTAGFDGILNVDYKFFLYGIEEFGGFQISELNNNAFHVRDVLDADTFTFSTLSGFSNRSETGGGSSVRINSKLHGWGGTHDNSPDGKLYKPVNLSGENYAYLCIPGLPGELMLTTDPVKNVVSKVFLTANPGFVIFSQYITEPIEFVDGPMATLDEVHFQFRNPDGFLLEFNGLEWSATLEITELIQVNKNNQAASTSVVVGVNDKFT